MKILDEDQFTTEFQARLRRTRDDMDLTQEAFAARLGLKAATYQKYETRPRSKFPLYLLPKLIVETERSYSYWCFGSPDNPTSRLKVIK